MKTKQVLLMTLFLAFFVIFNVKGQNYEDEFKIECITSNLITGKASKGYAFRISGKMNVWVAGAWEEINFSKEWVIGTDDGSFSLNYREYDIPSFFQNMTDARITLRSGNFRGTIIPLTSEFVEKHKCVETIAVENLFFDKKVLEMSSGAEEQLTVTIEPLNATEQTLIWKSSNETVAVVSNNGMVRALSGGVTVISAETKEGNITAYCPVAVKAIPDPVSIEIECANHKKIEGFISPKGKYAVTILQKDGREIFSGFKTEDGSFLVDLSSLNLPDMLSDCVVSFYSLMSPEESYTSEELGKEGVLCDPSSISKIQTSLNLYPNPTSDVLNISFDGAIDKIEIFSMQGNVILSETGNKSVFVGNLAKGTYVIRIYSGKQVTINKFIKS